MPAEKQSKGRRDSLLPDWGQIITIEYYRVNDTLSKRDYCERLYIMYRRFFQTVDIYKGEIYAYKRTIICSEYDAGVG